MAPTTAKFRMSGVRHAAVLQSTGGGTPTIVERDLHFINGLTFDPQTDEIVFEGDDESVRRNFLRGINVSVTLDTYDLAAVSTVFGKDEVAVTGTLGRTYFGNAVEVAGISCGLMSEVLAENLQSTTTERLRTVVPRGRMSVITPPTLGYNAKAQMALTFSGEKTAFDVINAALTGVVSTDPILWYMERMAV